MRHQLPTPIERHPPGWIPNSNISLDKHRCQQHHHHHPGPPTTTSRPRTLSPPQYSPPLQTIGIPFDPSGQTGVSPVKRSRLVIPSKRAAQNRAAQRAFRERRDRYVKELEIKAKEMENWPEKMDQLRGENKQLRDKVAALEQRVAELTGHTPASSSRTSACGQTTPTDAAPAPATNHQQESPSSPLSTPVLVQALPPASPHALPSPVHLREPHNFSSPPDSHENPHQMMHPSDTTSPTETPQSPFLISSVEASAIAAATAAAGLMPAGPLPPPAPPEMWTYDQFDLEFALDSYFQDEFGAGPLGSNVPTSVVDHGPIGGSSNESSGQVLDDLFEMLQSRQRPQIPLQPTDGEHDLGFHQHTTAMLPPPPSSFLSDLHPPGPGFMAE